MKRALIIYGCTMAVALAIEAGVAYLWLIGLAPQFEKQLSHH